MTVRVNKPEFNLREKLSELDYAHVPYEKMPAGSVIQASTLNIDQSVTFSSANFVTAYTHQFRPKIANSTTVHHFWSKTYLHNGTESTGQDYRLLGGLSTLDIDSNELIIRSSWQHYLNRSDYTADYYAPCDFIAFHKPNTTNLYNYTFQGRKYGGTAAGWIIGDTNMSGGPSDNRGCWIIYEVVQ